MTTAAPVTGVVHLTGGGVYEVVLADGTRVEASLRGRLKLERRTGDAVVIGDRVRLGGDPGSFTIEEVEPRASELVRRSRRGRDARVVAANLDRAFAVVSLADLPARIHLVDRLLALGEAARLRPSLVLNKVDLDGVRSAADALAKLYGQIGYPVFVVSATTNEGISALEPDVCAGTSALIGPSGAGKSSLLNALDPSLGLRTGELSRRTGGGRHTTVSSRLIRLACGGLVADTPGFGDVGLWRIPVEDVAACFPELEPHAATCRFRGCAHVSEPDCGVRAAVDRGGVAESRYESYLRLRGEAVAGSR